MNACAEVSHWLSFGEVLDSHSLTESLFFLSVLATDHWRDIGTLALGQARFGGTEGC